MPLGTLRFTDSIRLSNLYIDSGFLQVYVVIAPTVSSLSIKSKTKWTVGGFDPCNSHLFYS